LIRIERLGHSVKHFLMAERLGQKVDGAGLMPARTSEYRHDPS